MTDPSRQLLRVAEQFTQSLAHKQKTPLLAGAAAPYDAHEPPPRAQLNHRYRLRVLVGALGQLMASSGPFYRPDKTSETADRTSLKAAKRSPRAASVPKLSGVNIYHLRLMTGIAISTLIQRFRDPERRWV